MRCREGCRVEKGRGKENAKWKGETEREEEERIGGGREES